MSNGLRDLRRACARLGGLLDAIIRFSGKFVAWLVIILVAITVYDVLMRYAFRQGSVAIQELEWHLFAAIFLLAGGHTLREDGHVRVDVLFRSRFVSERGRRIIDVIGTIAFLLPFSALMVWSSIPFVSDAFIYHEVSPDPGGLSYRWVAKALIPLGFGLLFVQGLASLMQLFDDDRGAH